MKTIEVVAAVFQKENKILCMQRKESSHKETSLKFEFPGGKREKEETHLEALVREIKEEMNLNLNFKEEDFFIKVEHTYLNFHITMYTYLYHIKNEAFTFEMRDHVAFRWCFKHELRSLDWAPADLPVVQKLEEILP